MSDGTPPRETTGKGRRLMWALKVLLFLLFLAGGVVGGLAAGGGLYVLAGDLAPKVATLPFVGEKAQRLLLSLEPPLDRFQRRELELRQTEEHLLSLQAELEAERVRLEAEKENLAKRKEELNQRQAALEEAEARMAKVTDESTLYEEMAESFGDMSSSNAAKIIVQLPAEEAAAVLDRLGDKERGRLLSKMPPEAAARLMRYLRGQWEGKR
jgi:flagellar motility protein MotE (MotC chaperone)